VGGDGRGQIRGQAGRRELLRGDPPPVVERPPHGDHGEAAPRSLGVVPRRLPRHGVEGVGERTDLRVEAFLQVQDRSEPLQGSGSG
jgi:hypothetical protein